MSDNFDINSLLDGTLDDLADLPEFKPYPPGTHVVSLKIVDKTAPKARINGHPAFEVCMTAVETVELNNSDDTPLKAGDETSVLYMLDNEIGQGSFKNLLKAAAEHFGPKSNRELIADLDGSTAMVVTKQRQNKEKTKAYTDIVELKVV